jgi:hypothetical protein
MELEKVYPLNKKPTDYFIKGPIPLNWFQEASRLNGNALKVGMLLWFLKGLTRSNKFKVQNKFIRQTGISRRSYYAPLEKLEAASLIKTYTAPGKSYIVEIVS